MILPADYILIVSAIDAFMQASNDSNTELDAINAILSELNTDASIINPFISQSELSRPDQTFLELRQAVVKLQSIIIQNSGSVNTYLANENLTVGTLFAQLSTFLGFPIASGYIS